MKQIKNFVKNTFKNFPKEEREALVSSITEMLIEKVEDLMEKGMSEQDAIDQAVLEFGTVDDYTNHPKRIERKLKVQKTIKHYRNDLLFSTVGTLFIISILVFVNLYYVPGNLWFVVPSIAILWWPLAILYRLLNKKETKRGNKDE